MLPDPANCASRSMSPVSPSSSPLRRTQSLGYLGPGSTGNLDHTGGSGATPSRRLPDPGQGQLIRLVSQKLDDEAKIRLEVGWVLCSALFVNAAVFFLLLFC